MACTEELYRNEKLQDSELQASNNFITKARSGEARRSSRPGAARTLTPVKSSKARRRSWPTHASRTRTSTAVSPEGMAGGRRMYTPILSGEARWRCQPAPRRTHAHAARQSSRIPAALRTPKRLGGAAGPQHQQRPRGSAEQPPPPALRTPTRLGGGAGLPPHARPRGVGEREGGREREKGRRRERKADGERERERERERQRETERDRERDSSHSSIFAGCGFDCAGFGFACRQGA